MSWRATSMHFLNTSRNGDSTTSLCSLMTVLINKIFIIFSINLCDNVIPLDRCLCGQSLWVQSLVRHRLSAQWVTVLLGRAAWASVPFLCPFLLQVSFHALADTPHPGYGHSTRTSFIGLRCLVDMASGLTWVSFVTVSSWQVSLLPWHSPRSGNTHVSLAPH